MKEYRSEEIRTYTNIWKMPIKIYSIEKTKLAIPVGLYDLVLFCIWELFFIVLNSFEFFKGVPNTLKFFLFPFVLMKIMSVIELEGKSPHRYFFDLVLFWIIPKQYEYFRPIKKEKSLKFEKSKIYFTTYK
jgi:hypothetical protein